jgi:hypothetical protein
MSVHAWREQILDIDNALQRYHDRVTLLEHRCDHLQAKIDSLMLEYCPDEMTLSQITEWAKHQRQVEVNNDYTNTPD